MGDGPPSLSTEIRIGRTGKSLALLVDVWKFHDKRCFPLETEGSDTCTQTHYLRVTSSITTVASLKMILVGSADPSVGCIRPVLVNSGRLSNGNREA